MQSEYKVNVNKKKKVNETHFHFYFLHLCLSFYLLSYHVPDSLPYLSHQIITAEHKMPRTGRPKKVFKNPADQLRAAQAADRRAILVARNKIKKTPEWINANEEEQKSIMNRVKEDVMCERENHGLSGKKYRQF